MSRFVSINGEYLNMDMIASARKVGKDRACVVLKDGTERIVHSCELDAFDSRNKIIQVIPVSSPLYVIYETEDAASEVIIYYLGLTELGELRPLILVSDQYFDFADNAEGYLGMHEHEGVG